MTIRSEEIEEEILSRLMGGESLRHICKSDGMPDRVTVFRWMAAGGDFATKCAHARVIQADAIEDDLSVIEEDVLSGIVDPQAARVVIASKQWRAAKLAPKKYGDKLDLTHSGGIKFERIESVIVDPGTTASVPDPKS